MELRSTAANAPDANIPTKLVTFFMSIFLFFRLYRVRRPPQPVLALGENLTLVFVALMLATVSIVPVQRPADTIGTFAAGTSGLVIIVKPLLLRKRIKLRRVLDDLQVLAMSCVGFTMYPPQADWRC